MRAIQSNPFHGENHAAEFQQKKETRRNGYGKTCSILIVNTDKQLSVLIDYFRRSLDTDNVNKRNSDVHRLFLDLHNVDNDPISEYNFIDPISDFYYTENLAEIDIGG